MSDYLHGAYAELRVAGARVSDDSQSAVVYVGTAPVHTLEGGAANVNKPVLVHSIAEARKLFGYDDDWAKYTLCEAMKVHLEQVGVGPLVLINVLDPATHKAQDPTTVSKTPANGIITIASAGDIILDSVKVQTTASTPVVKVKGTDYTISYDWHKQLITIKEIGSGLGTSALNVVYDTVTPASVTASVVVGSSDGTGLNTGLHAVANVYQATGCVPAYLAAPGFSSDATVHAAMGDVSRKVNGHWDMYIWADLPLMNGATALTMATVAAYKAANGFNLENETVYFPLAEGTDARKYHLSVLAAANFQALLLEQDGIPYRTPSNTECAIIKGLYMGDANAARVYDDGIINECLNKNGIASAVYLGGRWVIWGAHSAAYDQTNGDEINVAETNRMMLYYISNDFQSRRAADVDRPMTANDLRTIVSEEQSRLDALVKIGALTFGEVALNADYEARSDIMKGDFSFTFNVTTTPLAKSLTAVVNWTDEGFVTYFESFYATDE